MSRQEGLAEMLLKLVDLGHCVLDLSGPISQSLIQLVVLHSEFSLAVFYHELFKRSKCLSLLNVGEASFLKGYL